MKSDEEARSTVRPPVAAEDPDEPRPDISAAILRAKAHTSVARSGPPTATAKINKFDLAHALALTTADGEAVPPSSRPPREDDAPFVAGEVEVLGEEEVNSGVPGLDSVPQSTRKSAEVKISLVEPAPAIEPPPVAGEASAMEPAKRSSKLTLAIIAALVGLIVIGYVYLHTR